MKIQTKLAFGFGIQILFTVALALSVLFGMDKITRLFSQVVEVDAHVLANAKDLEKLVIDMETGQRGFCITQNEAFLEPYVNGSKKFNALIEVEKQLVKSNPDQVARLNHIERLVLEWQDKAAKPEIAARREMNNHPDSLKHVRAMLEAGTRKKLVDQIRREFATFVKIERAHAAEDYKAASTTSAISRNVTIVLFVLAICIGAIVAVVIGRTVSRPLAKLTGGVKAIASGALDTKIEGDSTGEIGSLINAFNGMATELNEAQQRLELAATTDKLTGLPNRALFGNRLEETLKRSRRTDSKW